MTDTNRWPRLTTRQSRVLQFMRDHLAEHGYPPSVREIGREVGLSSTSSVHHVLRTLAMKGYVERRPDAVRALTLIHGGAAGRCPTCGQITNGGTA